MEEIGVVKSTEGMHAVVEVRRKSACEHCTLGTCQFTDDAAEIEAVNKAGAEVGQKVRLVLVPYTYLKGSMLIYGLPALAMIIGAVLGKEVLSGYITGVDADGVSAMTAFALCALSFVFVKIWSGRKPKGKEQKKPVIEEIIQE